jgi:hypothetical protein
MSAPRRRPTSVRSGIVTDYWFKRRRYGWGYFPSSWQGWAATALLLVLVIGPALFISDDNDSTALAVGYVVYVLVVAAGFLAVAVLKGPTPKWRWGRSPSDHPDEDF